MMNDWDAKVAELEYLHQRARKAKADFERLKLEFEKSLRKTL